MSYYFGLLPQLYKGRIEMIEQNKKVPLELSILTTCIREGFDNPYKLAIHTYYKEVTEKSRIQVHQLFDIHEIQLPEINSNNEFKDLIRNVKSLFFVAKI